MKILYNLLFLILLICLLGIITCGIMIILDKEIISIILGSITVIAGIFGFIAYLTVWIKWND